ncbi:MAG: HEAT repeat domain-containing protein [Planctomycetaceae bacterium]|nr:HEAT repeat domain-containing protein [Planctomycetaceae bacterium]
MPEKRLGAILEQITRRGNEHDLAYVYQLATQPDGFDTELKLRTFELLAEAAAKRQVIPAGDLSGIADIISSDATKESDELRLVAVRLAGLWKVPSAVEPLRTVLADSGSSARIQPAALEALASIGGTAVIKSLVELSGEGHSLDIRQQAVASLVPIDVDRASEQAVALLSQLGEGESPAPMISAFLNVRNASAILANAIEQSPPSKDVAMLSLRHMYSVGRSDGELSTALGKIAGIDVDPQPLTPAQVTTKLKEVEAHGDAHRGEAVFRRADLSCMKCHAVSKAGGQIGPDLSALGASSPVDYIINSISNPDQQIKEAFVTRVVITDEGLVHQGIVVDRTKEQLVLKDATGKLVTIPTASIDEEVEGKSLMPKGLMKFMTDAEFLDLVKFLSMLGKPGTEYAIRQTQRVQRWRVMTSAPKELVSGPVDETLLEDYLAGNPAMESAYSRVNGELPLDELTKSAGPVLFLQAEFDVTQAGEIGVRLDSAEGVQMWIGSRSSMEPEFTLSLPRGRQTILLRVDKDKRSSAVLKLELFRVDASSAEFTVMDGA